MRGIKVGFLITGLLVLGAAMSLYIGILSKKDRTPYQKHHLPEQSTQLSMSEKSVDPARSSLEKDQEPVEKSSPKSSVSKDTGLRTRIEQLLKKACSLDAGIRQKAREDVVAIGENAVPHLAALLKKQLHPRELRTVSELLTQISTLEAFKAVRTAIESAAENKKDIIASGMVEGTGAENSSELTDLIKNHPETAHRVKAGKKLGEVADEYVLDEVIDNYQSSDNEVQRSEYLETISNVSDPDAIGGLYNVMATTQDDDLYRSAASGLASVGTYHSVSLIVREAENTSGQERFAEASAALREVRNEETLGMLADNKNSQVNEIIEETLEELQQDQQEGQEVDAEEPTAAVDSEETESDVPAEEEVSDKDEVRIAVPFD